MHAKPHLLECSSQASLTDNYRVLVTIDHNYAETIGLNLTMQFSLEHRGVTPPLALPRQAEYFITQPDLDGHWNSLLPHSLTFQLCSPCQLPFLQWSHALRDTRSPIRLMNSVPAWLSSGRITPFCACSFRTSC